MESLVKLRIEKLSSHLIGQGWRLPSASYSTRIFLENMGTFPVIRFSFLVRLEKPDTRNASLLLRSGLADFVGDLELLEVLGEKFRELRGHLVVIGFILPSVARIQ